MLSYIKKECFFFFGKYKGTKEYKILGVYKDCVISKKKKEDKGFYADEMF